MSSFRRLATVTASTKRPPALAGGKRGAAVEHLTGLRCTPLDPADPAQRGEVERRRALGASSRLLTTMTESGLDIAEGDILVVGGVEYPIRAIGEWSWRGATYHQLFVEEVLA